MLYQVNPDCNHCSTKCLGVKTALEMINCRKHFVPTSRVRFIDLALECPTSLNEALSALPFETNIELYMERR